jgi:hypothetical protein
VRSAGDDSYLFDLIVCSWRYQLIVIILIVYLAVTKLMIRVGFIQSKEARDLYHMNLNLKAVFNKDSIFLGCLDYIISTCFMISTNFTTLGICSLVLNSKEIFEDLSVVNKGLSRSLSKILSLTFIGLSFVLFLDCFLYTPFNIFTWLSYPVGLLLCLFAIILNSRVKQKLIGARMKSSPPFETLIIQYINSTIISLLVGVVYQFITGQEYTSIVGWFSRVDILVLTSICFGVFGVCSIINTIYSSLYLEINTMKIIRLAEIPLNDIYAALLALYLIPFFNLTYIIAMFLGVLAVFITEFWKAIISKYK